MERWHAEVDAIFARGDRLHDAIRHHDLVSDELYELKVESGYFASIVLAGYVMQEMRHDNFPVDKIAGAVWEPILKVSIALFVARKIQTISTNNSGSVEEIAEAFRGYLQIVLDQTQERDRPDTNTRTEAIGRLIARDDAQLATLHSLLPPDVLAEFLGTTEALAENTFITYEILARANARTNQISAEFDKKAEQLERALRDAEAAEDVFIEAVKLARGFLPDTGETSDLSQLISFFDHPHLRRKNRKASRWTAPTNNRVFCRIALWLALGEIHWDTDSRETLIQLVDRPRKFSRYEPKTEAGREAKRALRCLKEQMCGVRQIHEHRSLIENVRSATSDAEILWVLSEYMLQRSDGNQKVGDMGEVGVRFAHAVHEICADDPINLLRIFAQVSVYDGAVSLRTAVDVEIERLEIEEHARILSLEEIANVEESPVVFVYRPFRARRNTSAAAATPYIRISYVLNPESAKPRKVSLSCEKSDVFHAILSLIEGNAVTPEPPTSLARAVYHYAFETSKEHRNTWSKERIGTFVFHKLKRGRARIYVRAEDDTVIFHAYARRDWEMPDAQK